jgi:hypothetical protein
LVLAVTAVTAVSTSCATAPEKIDIAIAVTAAAVGKALDRLPDSPEVVEGPPLHVDPPLMTFGRIRSGTADVRSAAITNAASRPVTVSGLSVSGRYFRLESSLTLPVELSPGARLHIRIWFEAHHACQCEGELAIEMGAPETKQLVSLTAVAIDAR